MKILLMLDIGVPQGLDSFKMSQNFALKYIFHLDIVKVGDEFPIKLGSDLLMREFGLWGCPS